MHGMSVDGCVSRTVRDTALFLDVASDFDDLAWHSMAKRPYLSALAEPSNGQVRIKVDMGGVFGVDPDPQVAQKVEEIARQLEGFGAKRLAEPFNWPARYGDDGRGMAFDFFRIWYTGTAYSALRDFSKCEPHTQAMRQRGLECSSIQYVESLCRLQIFTRHVLRQFREDLDVLVMPTIAPLPPRHGYLRQAEGPIDEMMMRATEMVPYTGWCNVTGQPAISVPAGFSNDGLPIGVQLIGRVGAEVQLLQLAEQLERKLEWEKAIPADFR
jgi:amidase